MTFDEIMSRMCTALAKASPLPSEPGDYVWEGIRIRVHAGPFGNVITKLPFWDVKDD